MRLGVLAPNAHLVRVLAGILLYGGSSAAIGIAFAKDRVDDAAEDLEVARLDVLFVIRGRVVWIIGDVVTLALQFLDRGPELRDRG